MRLWNSVSHIKVNPNIRLIEVLNQLGYAML